MLEKAISWLETHQGTCAFKEACGLECPGCGLQRSLITLLKGDLYESILMFPALIPLVIMFAFLGIHLIFKLRHGAFILKILYITNVTLILAGYVYKMILH